MTSSQFNIKVTWGVITIVASILGSSFMLGKKMSDETNKIYNSVEAVRTENRLQDKDIETLKKEVANKADKSDVDNLRERVNGRIIYRKVD